MAVAAEASVSANHRTLAKEFVGFVILRTVVEFIMSVVWSEQIPEKEVEAIP